MSKSSIRRKIRKKPFACPGRDNTSDIEEEYSDTLSLIQEKNIFLFPKITPDAIRAVLATSSICADYEDLLWWWKVVKTKVDYALILENGSRW